MTKISNSTTIHRKAKDGAPGNDAVIYTIVPAATVVAEGTTDVTLTLCKTVGATTTPVPYAQTIKDGITLTGEADATDHVQWTSLNQRLHVVNGMVYGNRYTITAINNKGQKLATLTIGVTARGAQGEQGPQGEPGERGQDGASITPKGTALRFFSNYGEYNLAEKESGIYLVNGRRDPHSVRPQSLSGAFLYTYDANADTTDIANAEESDCYVVAENGHLFSATPTGGSSLALGGNNLEWTDCGNITGKDAISIQVEGENVIFPDRGATQKVYVDVYRGNQKLTYGTDYTCSRLSAEGKSVLDGKVSWDFMSVARFYYYLTVKPDYRGTDISGTIPFTVTVDGVEYHRNINVRTVLNGSKGYNGCLIRRSEWQPGKTYRNDSDYNAFDPLTEQYIIDEVTITDENQNDHAYLVTAAHRGHTSGTMDEELEILIKPGRATDDGGWNYDTDNPYYTRLQMDAPIRVPFADIKQAIIDYLQVRQLVITDNDQPYGAFGGGNDWPLWFGGIDWLNSVFRVNRQGHLFSKKLVAFGTQAADGTPNGTRVEIANGVAKFYGSQSHPNITLGTDTNGCAILEFYDQAGNKMYDLGPNGLQYTKVQPLSLVVYPAVNSGVNCQYLSEDVVEWFHNNLTLANFNRIVSASVTSANRMYKFLAFINAGAYIPVNRGNYNVPYKMFDGSATGEMDLYIGSDLSAVSAAQYDQRVYRGPSVVSSGYDITKELWVGEIHDYRGPIPAEYLSLEPWYPASKKLDESDFTAGVRTRHVYIIDPTGHIALETNLYFQ